MERFREWLRENDILILAARPIADDRVVLRLQLPNDGIIGLTVKSDTLDKSIEVVKSFIAHRA